MPAPNAVELRYTPPKESAWAILRLRSVEPQQPARRRYVLPQRHLPSPRVPLAAHSPRLGRLWRGERTNAYLHGREGEGWGKGEGGWGASQRQSLRPVLRLSPCAWLPPKGV